MLIWRASCDPSHAFAYQMTSSSSPVTTISFSFLFLYICSLIVSLIIYIPIGRIALPIMLRDRVFRVMAWLRSDRNGVMTFASYRYQAIRRSPLSITRTPPLITVCTDSRHLHWQNAGDTLLSTLSIEAITPPSRKGNPGIIDLVVSTKTWTCLIIHLPRHVPVTAGNIHHMVWFGWRPYRSPWNGNKIRCR